MTGSVEAPKWVLREVAEEDRRRYRAEGWWPDHSMGERIAGALAAHRALPFVIHSRTHPWKGTFGDVLTLARRAATGLAARGVGVGDVVTFQTPNWIEGVVTFYGTALLGAVAAPIVHIYGSRETGYILGQCRPKVHVTASRFGHQDFLANLGSITELPEFQLVVTDGKVPSGASQFSDLLDEDPIDSPVRVDPASPALVGWTSGTTSNPKGVIHSHETVCAEIQQLGATSPPSEYPMLIANPISHAIGMLGALLIPIDRGRPVHLLDLWDPATVLDLIITEELNCGGGAPYFLTSLLDHPDFTGEHLGRLEYQGMGGAPVPRVIMERATDLGIIIYKMYGSTEHPSITGCTYVDELEKRLARDGRPLPGCEIRLVGPDGRDVPVGEPGEVISRGPDCFLGYTDPSLSAEVFDIDGWYHTGDVAIMDTDGYISITDRISDVIIRGGENISAAEVEEILMAIPGVSEVAVVAAPDARMGEHAAAFICMAQGTSVPDLAKVREHLDRGGVARQKWPEEVFGIEEFPRTSSGKVQKFVLRDRLRHA